MIQHKNNSSSAEKDFLDRSHEIYRGYNREKLFYSSGNYYNKLVTADPFHISSKEFRELKRRGKHLARWIDEQVEMFDEIQSSKSLSWIMNILKENHSPDTLRYQFMINRKRKTTKILRVDLSSFPFNCHEAQLRWGGIGHIDQVPKVFNSIVPFENYELEEMNTYIDGIVDETVRNACTNSSECGIYLTPPKFFIESSHFAKGIDNLIVMLVSDFNEQNFLFTGEDLIHKKSGKSVKIIFRRELTIETLSRTSFGRKVMDLYLVDALDFEPDLNIVNDAKLGMAFAFDARTKSFFSDQSRSLFLQTALYDDKFESFNSVFNTDFRSLNNFLSRTSQSERDYVYKYGGYDLEMSFGSSQVYRLDRTRNKAAEVIHSTKHLKPGEWIVQKFNGVRYPVRYATGDYNKRSTMKIEEADSCSARFMLFYKREKNSYKLFSGLANFVNDYWKARFKDSDTKNGKGAILTPIRVLAD